MDKTIAQKPVVPARTKWQRTWKKIWRYKALYLFLLPTIVYLLVFKYGPMYGIQIAFKNYNPARGIAESKWVGFMHFKSFLSSYYLLPMLKNTLTISLYSLCVSFPFPIITALILNEVRNVKYKKCVQTILYAPHFISSVVMCGMIITFLSPSTGIINFIMQIFGMEPYYFMAKPEAFKHIYVWSGIWQSTGWSAIIYLAALSGVDPTLHEAATIDGASRLQRIWHINFPTIKPTITILLIMSIGSLVSVGYEKVYLLQNDMNIDASEVISTYVYKRGLVSGNFSFSTAVGLLNNVVNIILLVLANFISRKVGETSLF